MDSAISNRINYIKSFDGIRCLALLMVMFRHASYGILAGGWIGVDLFFALSGYLITTLLINEYQKNGSINLAKFYIRRGLRLFPALIICVIIANILWPFSGSFGGNPNQLLASVASLFYFANLVPTALGSLAHL